MQAQEDLAKRLETQGRWLHAAEVLSIARLGLRDHPRWLRLSEREASLRAKGGQVAAARRILRQIWRRQTSGSARHDAFGLRAQHGALRDLWTLSTHPSQPDLLPPMYEQAHHLIALARSGQRQLAKQHMAWLTQAQWLSPSEVAVFEPHLRQLVRPRRKRPLDVSPPSSPSLGPMAQSIAEELTREHALSQAAQNQTRKGLQSLGASIQRAPFHPERTYEHAAQALRERRSGLLAMDALDLLQHPHANAIHADAMWLLALDLISRQTIQKAAIYLDRSLDMHHVGSRPSQPETSPHARALYWLGRVYESLGNHTNAHHFFGRVLQEHPLSLYAVLSMDAFRRSQEPRPLYTRPLQSTFAPIHPVVFDLYNSPTSPSQSAILLLKDRLAYQRAPHSLLHLAARLAPAPSPLQSLAVRHTLGPLRSSQGYFTSDDRPPPEIRIPSDWWDYIRKDARRNRLDPLWVFALIHTESNFKPKVCSASRACGLMQLKLSAAQTASRTIGLDPPTLQELSNPFLNITLGNTLLARLESKTQDPLRALASYNAGPGAVRRWDQTYGLAQSPGDLFLEWIPSERTRAYVTAIVTRYGHHSIRWNRGQLRSILPAPASLLSPTGSPVP